MNHTNSNASIRLETPAQLGHTVVANRIFMAPLTRLRNREPGDVPQDMAVTYYRQRATAGLIIAEGCHIAPTAKGYAGAPGIYNEEQVAQWKKITDAVHEEGGHIALQLWHTGRISHVSLMPEGVLPLGPSAIAAATNTTVFDEQGQLSRVPCSEPKAADHNDMAQILADFRRATELSKLAGFDFVEVHAAHGYLLDQFLSPAANLRTDEYGGSIENRSRLLLAVLDTVIDAWDADHVGIRVSPLGQFNGLSTVDLEDDALFVMARIQERGIAFLHISEPDWAGAPALTDGFRTNVRAVYPGFIIGAGAYTLDKAHRMLDAAWIDAVAFGRSYIANPDLARRLIEGWPLNQPDESTFYGGSTHGYTDYPYLEASVTV